jgi:hypothetical protein
VKPFYCKAYLLGALRNYQAWGEAGADLPDDTVVYLWNDFTVVRSPVGAPDGVLWHR